MRLRTAISRRNLSLVNILDGFIIAIGIGFFTWGFVRALSGCLATMVSLVLGFICALYAYSAMSELVRSWGVGADVAGLVAFAIIFAGIFIACRLAGAALGFTMKKISLGWLNRILGALLGTVIAFLFSLGLVVGLGAALSPESDLLKTSKLAPFIMTAGSEAVVLIPGHLRERVIEKQRSILKLPPRNDAPPPPSPRPKGTGSPERPPR